MMWFDDILKKAQEIFAGDRKVNNQEKLEKAKRIFFDFGGSHYGMWHEMVLDEYKKYHISEELEKQWRYEMLDKAVANINSTCNNEVIEDNIFKYAAVGRDFVSKKVINTLVEYIEANFDNLDTFTVSRGIEECVGLHQKSEIVFIHIEYFSETIENLIKLMKKNLERGVIIADERYREDGKLPDYIMPEEQIKRMNRDIEEWQEMLM